MAFSQTTNNNGIPEMVGRLKMTSGTYNCASVTTGELDTGLTRVHVAILQKTGAAVATNANAINETFPSAPGILTIITDTSETGTWMALGE